MRALTTLILSAVLSLTAACSGTSDPAPIAPAAATAPATSAALDRPEAIVSLSPTATEMLFAVGAGDQVIAVDDQSDYPPEAPVTDLSGFEPNLEAIIGYSPDLVVAADDTGDLAAGLEAAGVDLLLLPAAAGLDDTYAQLEQVGAATGRSAEAEEVVAQIQGDIDDILAGLPAAAEGLTYYHELDPTYYSVTGGTFIGEVYDLIGLTSIADETSGDAYPQLSPEFIVSADPDVIFLADTVCCGVTPEQVAARDGWSTMSAVNGGRIYPIDEDIASRWGPRIVDFMRTVADQVAQLAPVG